MSDRTVFLSSTANDLNEYREASYRAIEGLDGYHCIRMEDFGARDWVSEEFCRAKVAACDIFVGIIGHIFGSCPEGSEKSYTEIEYDTAVSSAIPRLMFVAAEGFQIPASLRESDDKHKRQVSFRERVNI